MSADLAGHIVFLVWANPNVFVHSHIFDADLDIVPYCSCECLQVSYLNTLGVPVCLIEAVLLFGKCINRPGCNSLCDGPSTASKRGVGWGELEGKMV